MAAPFIIAFDPATNTGICEGRVGEDPKLYAQCFRFGDDRVEDLFGAATYFLSSFLKKRKPDIIVVEGLVSAAGFTNDKTILITRGLYGVFTGIAIAKGIELKIAPVGTWRRFFLGKGNLKGKDAKAQCMERCRVLGWQAPTHDAAEAAGIWCWAASQLDPRHAQRIEPLFARPAA